MKMNLIELHILQSFPVTCLNRDDLGAPKSARFGGVERARVSSQCWKRAVREFAHEAKPELFGASRSKILGPAIDKAAKEFGADDQLAAAVKEIVLEAMNKDEKRADMVKTLFFFSPESLKNVVRPLVTEGDKKLSGEIVEALLSGDDKKIKKAKKETEKISKDLLKAFGEKVSDAADIALFGRMVADDASQTVEGAALFSHALSTHAVRSELDFFSAVDDEKKNADDAGAGQIGQIEYSSACYYRYIGVNLDLLAKSNLFDQTQMKSVLENFIRAAILANPSARKNSMFGQGLPSYVLAVKRSGQPLSLANAFEKPIEAKRGSGFIEPSIAALKKEWADLKVAFGIGGGIECEIEKGKEGTESLAGVLEKLLVDI
jgi:CRISPR system Cascade subunit CasC